MAVPLPLLPVPDEPGVMPVVLPESMEELVAPPVADPVPVGA